MTTLINRYIPEAEIEERACYFLHQYAHQFQPILQPPVPVEQIIDLVLDIPIVWESIPDQDDKPVLAKLIVKRERVQIIINESQSGFFEEHRGVVAYSLAHELGHHALHIDRASLLAQTLMSDDERAVVLCRGPIESKHDRREWQAERFAAYLLMPKELILKMSSDVDLFNWANLYQLKDIFGVSITALVRRLKDLHLVTVNSDRRLMPYQVNSAEGLASLWD
jgi:Zn-dependent peptidase ImmA (M78 family)